MFKVDLKEHNCKTYAELIDIFKHGNRVAIVQATGTGKSYVIMQISHDYKNVAKLLIAPSREIIKQFKNNPNWDSSNTECITYQKLCSMYARKQVNKDNFGNLELIVIDELHRTGAGKWGKAITALLDLYPNAKVVGATATPTRALDNNRNMVDEIFHANSVGNLSLKDAIERGIIPKPIYVSALYSITEDIQKLETRINKFNDKNKAQQFRKTLNKVKLDWTNTSGMPKVLRDNLKLDSGKIMVFCPSVSKLEELKPEITQWFKDAYPNKHINVASCHYKNNDNTALDVFRNTDKSNYIQILLVVDKFNEGIHVNDIDAVMMLRRTSSNIIYYQQVGRALSVSSDKTPIIFDLVNNCNLVGQAVSFWTHMKFQSIDSKTLDKKIIYDLKQSDHVHFIDYTKDFISVITDIEEKTAKNTPTYSALDIEIIKKYYPSGGANLCVKNNCSLHVCSIVTLAKTLGIRYTANEWAEDEIRILEKHFPIEGYAIIKRLHLKSINQILQESLKRNICVTHTDTDTWTEESINILKLFYPQEGRNVLKRLEGITKSNFDRMLRILKLHKQNPAWTKEEDKIMKEKYPTEGTAVSLRFENRSFSSVTQRARELGIKVEAKRWGEEQYKRAQAYIETYGT